LEDVSHVDFSNIKLPKMPDVPAFALDDVHDFRVLRSRQVPDTEIAETRRQEL
jgi:hypothetical protein